MATRRIFSAGEKARILKAADEAIPGQLEALLRKEGIYASHLQKWRVKSRFGFRAKETWASG